MKRIRNACIAVAFIFIVSCSSGSSPQDQLKKIDELMSKGFPMTTEQSADVNTFLAEGKRLLGEGKEKESSEALEKVIKVLQLAQDAYIFNKAD